MSLLLNNYSFSYDGKTDALSSISFKIDSPSFVTIVGASGSGKTTLLKSACGLLNSNKLSVKKGIVKLFGKDPKE